MNLQVVILAAGAGSRMKSKLPKVLHKVCGQAMLHHVLDGAKSAGIKDCITIIGHGAEEVRASLDSNIKTVVQENQLGTGHAVKMAYDMLIGEGTILVLNGDGPLIREETLRQLIDFHHGGGYKATVLTADLEDPYGYGRIVRKNQNQLYKIVEEGDASQEEKEIREINSGLYCFDAKSLRESLFKITNKNVQGEYYITDSLGIIMDMGGQVGLYKTKDQEDIMAVNTRQQLAQVEAIMQRRINQTHMDQGVTIIRPDQTYIEKGVEIGQDVIIYPGSILKGKTRIGPACTIGANTTIENSTIGARVNIQNSTIIDSHLGHDCNIGPYAYLRPNCRIGNHVKLGSFVEVKNSLMGDYSQASHLAYIGDAEIGQDVNIGCGVVFVNYDGKDKHKATIKDYAFIGSNCNIIAPVTVEESAYIASGSTITRDVGAGDLAVGRSRQENKKGWVRRKGLLKTREE